jgi:hypothetical protein
MIINDLEFFNSFDFDRKCQKDDVAIRGGASSSSTSSNHNGKTYASISISEGDDSYSLVMDGDKVVKKYGKENVSFGAHNYSASYKVNEYGSVSYGCVVN